jgi:hypothetical protein
VGDRTGQLAGVDLQPWGGGRGAQYCPGQGVVTTSAQDVGRGVDTGVLDQHPEQKPGR